MKVKSIMSTPVVHVGMDDRLEKVYRILLDNRHYHHVVVMQEKKVIGLVSDSDLFRAISPRTGTALATSYDDAALNKRVHQVMSRQPVTVNQDKGLLAAIQLFNRHPVSCLPVLDDDGFCVGILSWRDIFRQIEALKNASELVRQAKLAKTNDVPPRIDNALAGQKERD